MENEVRIDKAELIPEVEKMMARKATFGTATCLDLGSKFEVIYHFKLEQGMKINHIRVQVAKDDTIPSISGIYLCAALIENEITELFGISISDIALDFKGGMLVTGESPKTYLIKPPNYKPEAPVRLPTPCHRACPAGIDVPRYVRLIGEGKMDEALTVIKQSAPFPGILGRVCLAPCEASCRQGKQGEPIAVRQLKRFAYERGTYQEKVTAKLTGKQVAIIGSGPAGLTAAYFLAKMGHSVTVYEALVEPGGCMRVGIPDTELPRKILEHEIDNVRQLGVEIKLNARVDSLGPLLQQGYQAILVAIGAHQGVRRGALVAAVAGRPEVLKQFGLEVKSIRGNSALEVDAASLVTSREGVFAAGDVTLGPTSVIHAIASGKKAADSIDNYLGSNGQWKAEEIKAREPLSRDTFIERLEVKRRPKTPFVSLEEAKKLGEEEIGLTEEMAIAEGKRCWRCDLEE